MDSAARGDSDAADAAGPVDSLLAALQRHDADRTSALLSPNARLTVPPLRIDLSGREQVAQALLDVASAFDGIGYTVRGRYLTPGSVTDETVMTGTHVRDLLGAPPTHRASAVPARLIAGHDGQMVTRLDLWPDVAAVRDICEETSRHIDAYVQGSAGAMVAALRATIPAADPRVVHGTTRQVLAPSPFEAPEGPDGGTPGDDAVLPEPSPGRTDGTRLPVTRMVRRRRALAAGGVMLAASAGLIAWIAQGALNAPGGDSVLSFNQQTAAPPSASPASPAPTPSPTEAATTEPPGASASASVEPFTLVDNQFNLPTDFLFETGESKLTPEAEATLLKIVDRIIADRRYGDIVVDGHTDNVGTAAFNLGLSRRRATAVAAVLKRGLPAPNWRVVSRGYGMTQPRETNATEAGRARNRRVSIKVPPANSPLPSATASPTPSTAAGATPSRAPKPSPTRTTPKAAPSRTGSSPSVTSEPSPTAENT